MSKRYKATRTFWYQPAEGGPEQLAVEGELIPAGALSESKVAALLADSMIRESRAQEK